MRYTIRIDAFCILTDTLPSLTARAMECPTPEVYIEKNAVHIFSVSWLHQQASKIYDAHGSFVHIFF